MRESKEYERAKFHGTTIESEVYYDKGFVEGYENCYETHKPFLEWQKPEDVELENGKKYLVKYTKDNVTDWDTFVAKYDKEKSCFYDEQGCRYKSLLIKQIEV